MNKILLTIILNSGAVKVLRITGDPDEVNIESGNEFLESLAETGMLRVKIEEDDPSTLEVSDENGKFKKVDALLIQGTEIALIEVRKE